jgi:hypothetical protein
LLEGPADHVGGGGRRGGSKTEGVGEVDSGDFDGNVDLVDFGAEEGELRSFGNFLSGLALDVFVDVPAEKDED